jgi:hypothetical protein
MERIPDSGEVYDPVSMTTIVTTSLNGGRNVMRTNDICLDTGGLQPVGRSSIPVATID